MEHATERTIGQFRKRLASVTSAKGVDVKYLNSSLNHNGFTTTLPVAVLARNIWRHGPMASAIAQAYNRGLGQSPQQNPGAEPLVRGSRGETP